VLGGDAELLDAVRSYEEYVAGEVLATSLTLDGTEGAQTAEIEGRVLAIDVERA
jgi:hypothetical protein